MPTPFQHLARLGMNKHRSSKLPARGTGQPRLEELETRLAPAVIQVSSTNGSIQAAVNAARLNADKNDTIVLSSGTLKAVNVQITVRQGETLTIIGKGPGQTILNASQRNRALVITGLGTNPDTMGKVTLAKMTVANGNVAGKGGGLLINSGKVNLNHVAVQNNVARGVNGQSGQPGQDGLGGGIFMTNGILNLYHSSVTANQALGGKGSNGTVGGDGGHAYGGGLFVSNGTVIGQSSSFTANVAKGGDGGTGTDGQGGKGGNGGKAHGGGFGADRGKLILFAPRIANNRAQGGKGGDGGLASTVPGTGTGGDGGMGGLASGGGGHSFRAWVTLIHTPDAACISLNQALGGDGGWGNAGQTAPEEYDGFKDSYGGVTRFNGGKGGDGGAAFGGGLASGHVIELYGVTLEYCLARGGKGGDGGNGADGVMDLSPIYVDYGGDLATSMPVVGATAATGVAGAGGPATGGGLHFDGSAFVYLATLSNDQAIGGAGGKEAMVALPGLANLVIMDRLYTPHTPILQQVVARAERSCLIP
ncbi:MAG: hypothetical protein U0840_11460 [Gemmataceae bacterium]